MSMNGPSEPRFSSSGSLRYIRLFVPTVIAFILGVVLYAWRPIWLAPPYHALSPALYFLLALGWIPFGVYAVWHLPKHRLLVAILAILFAQLTCAAGYMISPHTYYELLHMRGKDYGSLKSGSLEEQHCELQAQEFTCELAVGSSDSEMAVYLSYRFKVANHLPIMWLTSFRSRLGCNPAYISCSEPDSS